MMRTTTSKRPIMRATEAQLYVADVAASCAYFVDKLGFTVAFTSGDPPFYGQVRRDGAFLNLRMVREPVYAGDVREREGLLAATITIATAAEIAALSDAFAAADARFVQPLQTEPWGATTFVVADPDGNRILFAAPAA